MDNKLAAIVMAACVMVPLLPATAQTKPATPSSGQANSAELQRQTVEVAAYLVGVMDTSAQAATNAKAPSVRMTTCQITVEKLATASPAIFLYQEQALSRDLATPYRQRFLRISPSLPSQSVQSLSYKPANPAAWVGLCNKPETDRVVQSKDLGQPVCSVFLRRSGSAYVGSTPVQGCPANVRGAVRITNRIVLNSSGMDTWDRGFDAQGKQVWGAQSESYQYRRISVGG